VIVATVALLCGGGTIAVLVVTNALMGAASAAEDRTEEYLDDVASGDYGGAYDQLCGLIRGQLTQAQYAALLRDKPLESYDVLHATSKVGTGGSHAYVEVEMTPEGGVTERHRIELVREGDDWKVCRGA
jgi:hypothetical protein